MYISFVVTFHIVRGFHGSRFGVDVYAGVGRLEVLDRYHGVYLHAARQAQFGSEVVNYPLNREGAKPLLRLFRARPASKVVSVIKVKVYVVSSL